MSNSEDCRIGKELKQSTCRYVKECKRGWTRNDKFICRKTNRRLVSPKQFTTSDPSKAKRASRKVDSVDVSKSFTRTNPRKAKPAIEDNEFSPRASSRSTPNKTFTKLKSKSKKKYEIGNTFIYTHPNGRKEKATVTRVGDNDKVELHIPSLSNNWAKYGAPKFKKNQKVFFIYKSGMKEQAVVKKVYDGEYDVYLVTQQRIKRVKENQIRALSDYKLIDEFPYYVSKSA